MFSARVEKDSIATNGKRLTTVVVTYPRFIHAEILTHRDRARNSASSRAIPWSTMMAAISSDPVVPMFWGSEQRGMQTGGEIDSPDEATQVWLEARDNAVASAKKLAALGVHKSLVNRLTEPFMWITVVMTATEWLNFYRLRCHQDAEIHFQKIAGMIRDAISESKPTFIGHGNWHLPFMGEEDFTAVNEFLRSDAGRGSLFTETCCRMSVARCARVSYLTHDGKRDPKSDLGLFDKLVQGSGFGHWSAHEHVATPMLSSNSRSGPYCGWSQFRKTFANETLEG